jgi:hypothetical protein
MWIKLINTTVIPNQELILDENFLLQCDYRVNSIKRAVIACMRILDLSNSDTLETKIKDFISLEDFKIELYSGDAVVKSFRGCFSNYFIQDTSNGIVERAEFTAGFKNIDGALVQQSGG